MASYRLKRHYCELCLLLLGLVMGCWLRKLVFPVSDDKCKSQAKLPSRLLVDDSASSHENSPPSDDLLMIGVMTNRQNLATRAASIFATWGQSVPGKIVFYVGESDDILINDAENKRDDAWTSSAKELNVVIQETAERKWRDRKYGNKLPVVELPGIRDSVYPPRSKSFAMLRHMHFHYGARYKWFMRADDDVFVRTDLLEIFLLALDNKRLLYMGQPGIGKASERGKLGLKKGAPYCMGGPGVFLSSYALRRLVPYLSHCEQQVVTSHEDSELGRCVQRFLNLPCTRNLQMQMLFYQNYVGMNSSFAGPLHPPVFSALTLHPVKDAQQMFRLQLIFDMLKLEKLQLKQQRLLTATTAFSELPDDATKEKTSSIYDMQAERRSGERKLKEYSGNSELDNTKTHVHGYNTVTEGDAPFSGAPNIVAYRQGLLKEVITLPNRVMMNENQMNKTLVSKDANENKETDLSLNPSGNILDTSSVAGAVGGVTRDSEKQVRHEDTSRDPLGHVSYAKRRLLTSGGLGASFKNDFVSHIAEKIPDQRSIVFNNSFGKLLIGMNGWTPRLISDDDSVWDVQAVDNSVFFTTPQLHPARKLALFRAQRHFREYSRSGLVEREKLDKIVAMCQKTSVSQGMQHILTISTKRGYRNFLLSDRYDNLQWRELTEPFASPSSPDSSDNAESDRKDEPAHQTLLDRPSDLQTANVDHDNAGSNTIDGQKEIKEIFRELSPTSAGAPQRGGALPVYKPLWILLPLSGRHETYRRFLGNLSSAAQHYAGSLHLKVALFPDSSKDHLLSAALIRQRLFTQPNLEITMVEMNGTFSRAHALQTLAAGLEESSQLVLMDVDLVLTQHFLKRAAANAGPGRAYFPVYLAQYHPDTVCYRVSPCTRQLFDFSRDAGTWRHFSYGVAVLMAGDLRRAGGLDTSIRGWGKEDVDLYIKCVSHGLEIVRALDPGLMHVHHQRSCDPALAADQLSMCKSSLAALYGSVHRLSQMVMDIEAKFNRTVRS